MAPTRLGDHPEWWRVRDVMTTDVARVRPDATYDEIVDVLTARGVSGIDGSDASCVTHTAKTLSRAFDAALAERGGSLASWLVLASLAGGLHRSQRSIAADVGVEGPTLTHHLNRMEADGLVTRTRDPQNRRAHHVEFTAEGHAEFHSLLDAVKAFDESLRAGFTVDELATLRELLQRLAANAAAHPSRSRGQGRKEPR